MVTNEITKTYPSRYRAYYALSMLMLTCILSFLDRQILSLLVGPIKADLGISDTQVGLLQGFAFVLLFCFMALPFGWLVDRYNRRNLLAFGIILWSGATVASGFASSFQDLLIARVAVGIGEASLMPAAYSLLADFFPPNQRARAFSCYTMASFVGIGIALTAGGWILSVFQAHNFVTLPLIGSVAVWQAAFIVVGLPGFIMALLILTLHEPKRTGAEETSHSGDTGSSTSLISHFRKHWIAFASVWSVYSLLAYVSYGVSPWAPTLFSRTYGFSGAQAGIAVGIVSLIGGCGGALTAGVLGDRWTARTLPGTKFRLPLFFWCFAGPSLALMTLTNSAIFAIAGLLGFVFFNSMGYVSASVVVQDMSPSRLRGQTIAAWYLIISIFGNGFGPLAAALVTDGVFHAESALRYSLLVMALPAIVIGLWLNLSGLRAFERTRSQVLPPEHVPTT
jgi:MFS family permease